MKPVVQKIFTSLSILLTVVIISSMVLVPGVSQAAPVSQESGDDSANKVYLPMVEVAGEAETAATPLLPEQYNSESEEAPTLSADQVQGATCYTNIKFTNSSSYPINIYWVNYTGGESLYKTLSSGSYYWQQTYYGHSWRVRSSSGALLKSFSVYTCSLVYITISNSDFPQPTATPTPAALPLVQCPAGTQSLVVNGSFEQPVISTSYASLNQSSVPGWRTHAGDGILELWRPAAGGLIPADGNQNLEVQANSNAAVYQDIATTPGTTFTWSFAHRGRSGNDTLAVKIGSVNALVVQQTVTTGNSAWQRYTGTYTVPAGQTTTRFKFEPVAWAGGNSSMGNLVDAVLICANPPAPTATNTPVPPTATNTAVPPTATNTVVPATATNTPVPPTATNTPGALGSIGNKVWNDSNANGVLNTGEAGVSGVSVQLKDCNGALLRTVVTDGNGNYGFNNQAAGCYLVTVVLPNNTFQFSPKDQGNDDAVDSDVNPANGTTDVINLSAGQQIFTVDIGIYQAVPATATNTPVPPTATPTKTPAVLGSIGNKVWNDSNANGVLNTGEAGVSGVSVQLKDCNGALLRTVVTDGNGNYGFNNQAAGCYLVTVVLPNNTFQFSPKDQGSDDAVDSDANPANGTTDVINLSAGQQIFTVDIGIYQAVPATATNTPVPPTATPTKTPAVLGSIGNKVWNDSNANGVLNTGEAGVSGVSVQLKDCNGALLRTVVTDGNGNYGFNNQAAGCYLVTVVLPNNTFQFSPKDQGSDDAVDSDVNPANGTTDVINLSAGQQIFTVDIGIYQAAPPTATNTPVPPTPTNTPVPPTPTNTPTPALGSIGDLVWKDLNRNGVQDGGEPGIGGISVTLWVDSDNDGVHDTLVGTTTTNSNGNYSFTGLNTSKRYVVKFGLPSCYSFTTPNVGSDVTDSDVTVFSYGGTDLVALTTTAHNVDVDAGMYKCY